MQGDKVPDVSVTQCCNYKTLYFLSFISSLSLQFPSSNTKTVKFSTSQKLHRLPSSSSSSSSHTLKFHTLTQIQIQPIFLPSSPSLSDHSPTMSTSNSLVLPLLLLLGLSPLFEAANGGTPPQELWCVAKNNAEDASLQVALDWACGAGGADCGPIQNGGPCYDPSSVQNTASFAFNDYFLKHGMTDDSCNFNNNAAVTSQNPSFGNCKFHSGMTGSNGSFSGSTPSSSVGLGPSEDLSGCRKVSWGWWLWPLMFMVSVF
ncbi:glucan endo-1,3-beta-glucosidase 2-like [Phaseolus vulgaris]|uniref:X8 domain-containing protein n=1 Tax=Phaseolus vulgaris TaxID=3885 RepID=V7AKQ9_PHAVU|nr:hypothetical protein PHAVU_011G117000g [Phaseolus vulgaris]ESW04691.1 hypothetical protein PHAVU_011G117000g [Phaseolus vulgaris]